MSVQVDGLQDTLKAFQGLEADLRRTANGELRQAAGRTATQGVALVQESAASCGVPAAPLVARSARVKSDRLPVISIGGPKRVGRYGAPASALLWGSEHGGHNFAAGPSSGYWIKPAVDRLKNGPAMAAYRAAVVQIMRRWKLL